METDTPAPDSSSSTSAASSTPTAQDERAPDGADLERERPAGYEERDRTTSRADLDAAPDTLCLNCGCALPGDYCPACGQRAEPLRQPIWTFLRGAFVEYVGLDGRVWPSLWSLVARPGRLTQAYLLGQRARYVRPLRLYLSSTLLFFVLLSLIDPASKAAGGLGDLGTSTDTVTVRAHLLETDSIMRALPEEFERTRARHDSLRLAIASFQGATGTAADSTEAWRLAAAVLSDSAVSGVGQNESIVEMLDDRLDDLGDPDSTEFIERMSRLRAERAVLLELDPDSLILPDDIHGPLRAMLGQSRSNFNGPDWLIRSPVARRARAARTPAEVQAALADFLRAVIGQVPVVMFVLLPVFALILKAVYIRRRWYYTEHLVFALHVHAYVFVVFAATVAVVAWSGSESWAGWVGTGLLVSIPVYQLIALKRVYGQGWIKTFVKQTVINSVYGLALMFGLVGAFLLAAVV